MKSKNFRELTKEELQHKYTELQKELFSLKFRTPTQETKNPVQMRYLRRDIAKILTILKEKDYNSTKM